jgi:hypothetical protein
MLEAQFPRTPNTGSLVSENRTYRKLSLLSSSCIETTHLLVLPRREKPFLGINTKIHNLRMPRGRFDNGLLTGDE